MTWRKKKLVRVHLENEHGSVEGLFVGFWADHYVIRMAEFVERPGSQHRRVGEDGRVPKSRVVFLQTL